MPADRLGVSAYENVERSLARSASMSGIQRSPNVQRFGVSSSSVPRTERPSPGHTGHEGTREIGFVGSWKVGARSAAMSISSMSSSWFRGVGVGVRVQVRQRASARRRSAGVGTRSSGAATVPPCHPPRRAECAHADVLARAKWVSRSCGESARASVTQDDRAQRREPIVRIRIQVDRSRTHCGHADRSREPARDRREDRDRSELLGRGLRRQRVLAHDGEARAGVVLARARSLFALAAPSFVAGARSRAVLDRRRGLDRAATASARVRLEHDPAVTAHAYEERARRSYTGDGVQDEQ